MTPDLLHSLESAHSELLGLLEQLAAMTLQAIPNQRELTDIRWKLSRASRARTRLIEERILPALRARASAAEIQRLDALQAEITTSAAMSSRHVSNWSVDRVLADWKEYQLASAETRRAMRKRIEAEKALLYELIRSAQSRPVRQA